MDVSTTRFARLADFLHHRLIWLLLLAYALAGMVPDFGMWMRTAHVGLTTVGDRPLTVSLTSVLLSLILFNAGLGVDPDRIRGLVKKGGLLAAGLLTNTLVPTAVILGLSTTLSLWHNPIEVQFILVGLALIASMPVAGSSTAWSQNANGDLALSLGLVIGSTVLSPLTTPAVLHVAGWAAEGPFSKDLHHLAENGTTDFLTAFVLIPSLAGIGARLVFGGPRLKPLRPAIKLVNTAVLLLLSYVNGAAALPQTFASPDWDFLGLMLTIVAALCVLGFASGLAVAWWFGADSGRRTSLAFGLGMTNNGTGLVLATNALAHIPEVTLPIIGYNLVQHFVAAAFDHARPYWDRRDAVDDPANDGPTPPLPETDFRFGSCKLRSIPVSLK